MRALVLALALLILPATASAAAPAKPAAWAKKHHLTGSWKGKDADRDGIKNLREFKLGTNPRRADSDRDGLKDGDELLSGNDPLHADSDGDGIRDGDEHAGVVLGFDGTTLTLRQFRGPLLSAVVEACEADADMASIPADETDWSEDDGDWSEGEEGDVSEDYEEVPADDELCLLEPGDVVNQAELESSDGITSFTAVELAD